MDIKKGTDENPTNILRGLEKSVLRELKASENLGLRFTRLQPPPVPRRRGRLSCRFVWAAVKPLCLCGLCALSGCFVSGSWTREE